MGAGGSAKIQNSWIPETLALVAEPVKSDGIIAKLDDEYVIKVDKLKIFKDWPARKACKKHAKVVLKLVKYATWRKKAAEPPPSSATESSNIWLDHYQRPFSMTVHGMFDEALMIVMDDTGMTDHTFLQCHGHSKTDKIGLKIKRVICPLENEDL